MATCTIFVVVGVFFSRYMNSLCLYTCMYAKIIEVNLFAFVNRLFHEELPIEHSTTCDSRTNLNYIHACIILNGFCVCGTCTRSTM